MFGIFYCNFANKSFLLFFFLRYNLSFCKSIKHEGWGEGTTHMYWVLKRLRNVLLFVAFPICRNSLNMQKSSGMMKA